MLRKLGAKKKRDMNLRRQLIKPLAGTKHN